jgi:L-histidine Nalpha-methyltransferase
MAPAALAQFHDLAPAVESFRDAVLAGLSARRKSIPCRFFYDDLGSALFEAICDLPEYYLTRTEIGILEGNAAAMARLIGPFCRLIEFGSGSSRKVRLLLEALDRPAAYVAIDIAREPLRRATESLAEQFPGIAVAAVCADYLRPFDLPALPQVQRGRRIGFFPGSTIGNFTPDEAVAFLAACRRVLGPDGAMLVGADLKKDPALLNAAYNDAAGVTAAFNLNLLVRINRELEGDFDLARFAHDAAYNIHEGRIELYIRSLADQTVTVAGRRVRFLAGERIHTEDSCKYTIAEFQELARRAGFAPRRCWTDGRQLFSVHFLECGPRDPAAGGSSG